MGAGCGGTGGERALLESLVEGDSCGSQDFALSQCSVFRGCDSFASVSTATLRDPVASVSFCSSLSSNT